MAHSNPSDEELKELLTSAKTIAIVGASSNPDKASYGIMRKLQQSGYRVIPVNPRETEVLGEPSYASLEDVPEKIEIVDVFRRRGGRSPRRCGCRPAPRTRRRPHAQEPAGWQSSWTPASARRTRSCGSRRK